MILQIDRKLMGSTPTQSKVEFSSDLLNRAIDEIYQKDQKRALQVISFYCDLRTSSHNVAKVIRKGGVVCYVVGNRKVKGVTLPTDQAIRAFFEETGFVHVATHQRKIPNKRMPLKNSPTNVSGVLDNTMTGEFIVVMQRR